MKSNSGFDFLIRMILIGDTGVGKTSLIMRFSEETFTPQHIATIGIDFKIKTMNIDGSNVKLQIWDTAGQERFRTITQTYYKGAQGIVLCYDSTSAVTFNNVEQWMQQIDQHATTDCEKLLLATKCDKETKVISSEEGLKLAKKFNMTFFETSAQTGLGVNEAFEHIAKSIKNKQTPGGPKRGFLNSRTNQVQLQKQSSEQQEKKKCC